MRIKDIKWVVSLVCLVILMMLAKLAHNVLFPNPIGAAVVPPSGQRTDMAIPPSLAALATPAVSPSPTTDPTTTLVGAGEIASCDNDNDEATAKLIDTIAGNVFTLGDNAFLHGTVDQYDKCYGPTWGRFKGRTKPAVGKHDYDTTAAEGFFNYFASALETADDAYYSYDLGAWHVVVLNSNCETLGCGANSAQSAWLKNDLAANSAKCTLAYMHQPLFSSGIVRGGNKAMLPLWRILYDGGVDVVLAANEHNYERFAPQDPDGAPDAVHGIREFVVGTGGGTLYPILKAAPNSQVHNSSSYGVLKLNLLPSGYDWEFVPVPGGTFTDTGTDACH